MSAVISAIVRSARPSFRSKHDRLAFALHAFVLGKGFKLVAVGKTADEAAAGPASSAEEVPVDGWQELQDAYAFKYVSDDTASRTLILKCIIAGDMLLAHAAAVGSTVEPSSVELNTDQYATESDDLVKGYRDLDGLAAVLESSLKPSVDAALSAGAPSEQRGNESTNKNTVGHGKASHGEAAERAEADRLREPLRATDPSGVPYLPHPAPGIGAGDFLPGGGLGPPGMGGPAGGPMRGGGMHVGPDSPMFDGRLRHPAGPSFGGPWVPGSRYDPIGPPGMEGFDPDDFRRGPPGRGGPSFHPDIGPPPGMGGTNWDNMFG
uniref:Proteasome inhibitor subunit 1 (PI31) n=1 Tax=Tetraselmis sp. GSL018 TaxID=582737 RepID=A0A061S9F9_9CHLO|eukprot:CAMPEP_0177598312 /NCGR_PEP_ID=MMETSP0419_2-20121207/12267_1 /TAXON_ID=582737 /ORGANISM="Tetraselmis sp., Strain GSL018" /LENGTH=320 /DNA_ID=CAMNT_0019090719 /DNA_START=82 /DNA_END=1044 /DNA_ORIENTATION=-